MFSEIWQVISLWHICLDKLFFYTSKKTWDIKKSDFIQYVDSMTEINNWFYFLLESYFPLFFT